MIFANNDSNLSIMVVLVTPFPFCKMSKTTGKRYRSEPCVLTGTNIIYKFQVCKLFNALMITLYVTSEKYSIIKKIEQQETHSASANQNPIGGLYWFNALKSQI